MARVIDAEELPSRATEIVDAVAAGETFIVTRNGRTVAELRPFAARRFVPKEDLVRLAPRDHIDAKQFREDIDRFVDQRLYDPYERRRPAD